MPMTLTPPLSPELTRQVLDYLGIKPDQSPTASLDELVDAYIRHVPWESASRIAKRLRTPRLEDRPRWPEEFWEDALQRGGGGTCFESNYAFFSLLRALGYEGYLTINDMEEQRGCHTAILLETAAGRWLVDVGIPLYAPLPFREGKTSQRENYFHRYTLAPDSSPRRYLVERDRHIKPYIFTLIDQPVGDADYRFATMRDYAPGGHFLDRVVITKVIGDSVWRINSGEQPLRLEQFQDGQHIEHPLQGDIASILAGRFSMDAGIIQDALRAVGL